MTTMAHKQIKLIQQYNELLGQKYDLYDEIDEVIENKNEEKLRTTKLSTNMLYSIDIQIENILGQINSEEQQYIDLRRTILHKLYNIQKEITAYTKSLSNNTINNAIELDLLILQNQLYECNNRLLHLVTIDDFEVFQKEFNKIRNIKWHERNTILEQGNGKIFNKNQFQVIPIIGDGNCLFRCISYIQYKTQSRHPEFRNAAINYTVGIITQFGQSPDQYKSRMAQDGEEANHEEIYALATKYSLKINILVVCNDSYKLDCIIENPNCVMKKRNVYLLYCSYSDPQKNIHDRDELDHYNILEPCTFIMDGFAK